MPPIMGFIIGIIMPFIIGFIIPPIIGFIIGIMFMAGFISVISSVQPYFGSQ